MQTLLHTHSIQNLNLANSSSSVQVSIKINTLIFVIHSRSWIMSKCFLKSDLTVENGSARFYKDREHSQVKRVLALAW